MFPEEVEAVLKAHPAVYDVLVVGVDDQRWGQARGRRGRAGAGRARRPSTSWPSTAGRSLAGYKVPRSLVLVDDVERSPAGKADYRWAQRTAVD